MARPFLAICCLTLAIAIVHGQAPPSAQATGTAIIVGQVIDAATGRGVADVAVTPTQVSYTPGGAGMITNRAILTDATGRFVLRGLLAGTYLVTARRNGYVESFYGAATATGEGKPVVLADGGKFGDATIRFWKLGVIAGTVVDEAGEPVMNLQVRAFKRNLIAGRWKFGEYYSNQKYGARTDDRGMYRLTDLEPGEYVVHVPLTSNVAPASAVAELEALRAEPSMRSAYQAAAESFGIGSFQIAGLPQNGSGTGNVVRVGDMLQTVMAPGLPPAAGPNGEWLMYQTQFYPNTNLARDAQPVAIAAGEERGGVDFNMRPLRTWRVSGTVTGLPAAQPISLRLLQADGDTLAEETLVAATVSEAGGSFTFLGVPAGQYAIKILRVPVLPDVVTVVGAGSRSEQAQGVSPDPTLWATVPVTVGSGDVTGVSVPINTGTRANGRLVFAGNSPKPTAAQLASYEITLEPAEGQRPLIYKSDRVRLAGEAFQTPELPPGKYVVRTRSLPPWTMKSAVAGDRDISNLPLVVDGREIPAITITLTDRPLASLRGTVRDGGSTARDALVCIFPVERTAWVDYGNSPRRLQRVQVNTAGAFAISNLAPGDYFAVAVPFDRAPDWRETRHLDALQRVASRVQIGDDEAKVLDLTVQKAPATSAEYSVAMHQSLEFVPDAENAAHLSSGPFVDDAGQTQQAPPRAVPRVTPESTGTGSISGVVTLDGPNPSPVRRVVVTLNAANPKVGRTVVTDDAGRFAFTALPAAQYSLAAAKLGFLTGRYGATKPGRPATPIVLADGVAATVRFPITRGSVITGTVRDERGEPLRGVSVMLMRYQLSGGERRLERSGGASQSTDDRGQYRIIQLEPGEYFVSTDTLNVGFYRSLRQTTAEDFASAQRELRSPMPASANATGTSTPEMGYPPAFFPGTPLFSQAMAVTVGAGEEKSGVDISVRLVALAHLTARVLGPDGQPPAMLQAALNPLVPFPGLAGARLNAGNLFPVTDGVARIDGIPPGDYTLDVGGSTVAPPPMAASSGGGTVIGQGVALGLPMWGSQPLTIDGRDIDNLTIQLQWGKKMTGHVVFEGAATPPASVQVSLNGPRTGGIMLTRRGNATPEFAIDGIVPASYKVAAVLRGWTIKSAVINGKDAADIPVEIVGDVADVVVTFTDKLTELSGTLQTSAGLPATDYFVIAFPKDPSYWLNGSRRIVSLRPAGDGRFATTATAPLPPGEYLIAAVTDVESGQWFDPTFLRELARAAIPIALGEGEKRRQDLQIK